MLTISQRIANELNVSVKQVDAAIQLLDEGATVPFIARYRKEVTNGLDDTQLRMLDERLGYMRELDDRRAAVLKLIDEQGKLTPELTREINEAETKVRLEDLYLPYKKKRRTKGQIAIEAGIEPLAEALLSNPELNPEVEAESYICHEEPLKESFGDVKAVLDGAKFILMERFTENADLIAELRSYFSENALLYSTVVSGKEDEGTKFRDYFDHQDKLSRIPSHRALAMFRGRKEDILQLKIDVEHDASLAHPCEGIIAKHSGIENHNRPADRWLAEVVRWTWTIKLKMRIELELFTDLHERAETGAIEVFARNMKDLLLAAPAGQRATLGLDPGLRTGVKIAIVDATGQFLDSSTIYPHAPRNRWDESIAELARLAQQYNIELLAIGNGTASRETEKLCAELIKRHPELKLHKVMVSEAGASVYSASELAAAEFPDLDVSIRGAVSIARRLQDPLAELVKIDPKSIGVGQYQHDVSQFQLARNLDAVVEDCVNSVGVEVNTASSALLSRVAGLNQTIAENIVEFRNQNGPFKARKSLMKVSRLGDKSFEQAAGFLRIHNAENPLDTSAVHPESYSVVQKIVEITKVDINTLIGNSKQLKSLDPADYTDEKFGLPTVTDIIAELDKPGRDPRPAFKTAQFKEGVEKLSDLTEGMILEGTVTNVTNFGAFVDIGVHQDGLVHISALANRFVKDPHEVVKAGEIVKVKVLEIDLKRKRIALTMRLEDKIEERSAKSHQFGSGSSSSKQATRPSHKQKGAHRDRASSAKPTRQGGALADAFARAKTGI
ncbi:MAG: RNA-binding transcriptional accessory protein [Gammaproteobacteria bacterium]|nr:RNA-binding transcriptional accessory protein [Gammaproteobacteria bacterium]